MDKSIPYKSSFLNNLSSKYTQEFSLAVIRSKTLKQSIYCQGVCSSLRYSIYKVQSRCAPGFAPFIAQLGYLIIPGLICQQLF